MHRLAQGLRKVKFRWNQVVIMATQNFKRNLLLILCREGKNLTLVVCFLLPLKREIKKSLMLAAYFLRLQTSSLPACYPLIPHLSFRRIMLPRERDIILIP